MPSLPSSPITPSRSRPQNSSNVDLSSPTSSNLYASSGTRARRRSSRTSEMSVPSSPITPRQQLGRAKSASLSVGNDSVYASGRRVENLENLADELADAWDDDDGGEAGSSFLEGLREGNVESPSIRDESYDSDMRDEEQDVRSPQNSWPKTILEEEAPPSPTRMSGNETTSPSKRRKRGQSRYNGSGNGFSTDDVDVERLGEITPSLDRRMAEIESLVNQGLDDESVREGGGVLSRTATALKDLGAQASIESGVSRLVTAYSSVAGHRTAKTKEIFSMAHSLLLARAFTLTEDEIDSLLTEIELLSNHLPLGHPGPPATSVTTTPLQSLHSLVASTTDLSHSLQSVSDLMQESRQASAAASRRLKAARDFVAELQQEDRACEGGVRYLEAGGWGGRLCDRQAASVCGDVVAGFETTCEEWRHRLFGARHPTQTVGMAR